MISSQEIPRVEDILAMVDAQRLEDDDNTLLLDLIHDVAEYDSEIDTSGVDDLDDILEMRNRHAASIYNQGIEDTLRYLLSRGMHKEVIDIALPFAISQHARLQLKIMAQASGPA